MTKYPKESDFWSEEFTSVLKEYVNTLTEKTGKEYWGSAKSICDFAGKDFFDLDGEDVERYFGMVEKKVSEMKYSPITFNVRRSHLNKLSNHIIENFPQYGVENYYIHIRGKRYDNGVKPGSIPTLEEMDKILQTAKECDYRAYAILVLAFRTGLKSSEIIDISRSSLTDDGEVMSLRFINRGRNDEIVVLPEDVSAVLRKHMETQAVNDMSGHLFVNEWGAPMTLRNLDHLVKKIITKSGYDYTIKDLRSRAIIDMINAAVKNGVDVDQTMEYTRLHGLRMNSYVEATAYSKKCPANLVNIRIISE